MSIDFDELEAFDRQHRAAFGWSGNGRAAPADDDGRPTPPLEAYAGEDVAQATRRSRFYSAADLAGLPVPERKWLVQDLIPQRNVTLLGGDGATGKSLLALQLAAATVGGGGWPGRGVERGAAIFMSAEDEDAELHRRVATIVATAPFEFADLGGLTLRSLAGEDALLATDGPLGLNETELLKELDARAEADGAHLIVLDTLADLYPANENDRAKARWFIGRLRGLALRRDCAVLLLAHPSLSGMASGTGTSGSTGWNNSVRSRLYLERVVTNGVEDDRDRRVLTSKKNNYGRAGHEIPLRWERGVFTPEGGAGTYGAAAAGAKAERIFMKLLDAYTAQGRFVSASPSTTYAPAQFAKDPECEGMTKAVLLKAMNNLFTRGEIVVAEHGKGSKARSHIARAGGPRDA